MAKKEKPVSKICKHCKTEIPYEAKVCPQCRKRVKGGVFKWILLAFVVIIIFSAVFGGGGKEKTEKTGEVTSGGNVESLEKTDGNAKTTSEKPDGNAKTMSEEPDGNAKTMSEEPDAPGEQIRDVDAVEDQKENEKTVYHVGDILQDGDLKIVYMSSGVHEEENDFLQPEEGYKYIFLQFAFENTSDQHDNSISCFSFECYADGYAAEAFYSGEESLSATLSPGRTTTGYIYFSVPENSADIEVEYEANVFTDRKITFVYEGEMDSGYVIERSTEPTEESVQVGDSVESSKLKITYLSCEEYTSENMFVQPKAGYHFISCTFEFENLGNSDAFISSLNFDCYADGISCDATHIREDDLSATISSGRKTQGTVTFEIPDDATVVEVEYLTNYFTSNRIVFAAS